jgi:hypothetical protein
MLKIASIGAALILAAAAFSTSAEAQHRGAGARMGGGHFSGARVGSVGGARMGTFSGARSGRIGAYGGRGIYRGGRVGAYGGRAIYGGRYAYGGRGIYRGGRYASGYGRGYGYRYPYRRYGGYWPWGLGAGLAVAATWPYYGDYGYDDCVQWRPDWGWVNVCQYPYGGYYPY